MTDEAKVPRVSAADRAAMARQARALRQAENDDEGTPEWRDAMRTSIDRRRAEQGIEPLEDLLVENTEWEVHERAKSLGLLRPLR